MSAPIEYTDQNLAAVSHKAGNWNINIRTVKVGNISLAASRRDIQEFFSFSGDIQYVEMQKESETTQLAYITFKDSHGAEMAILLTGAKVSDLSISVIPVEDYQLPPEAISLTSESKLGANNSSAVQRAEDVMSTMLAKGFVLGKDTIKKAKVLDERHNLTSNASATIASIDQKIGLADKLSVGTTVVSEKMREMDEWYQVSEITKSAIAAAEQKASDVGSTLMRNSYVSAGTSWLSSAFSAVAKAAEDVGVMTKEKVEKAEEEKREYVYRVKTSIVNDYANTHLDDSALGSPVVPMDSPDIR